jgi:hypothetical protein
MPLVRYFYNCPSKRKRKNINEIISSKSKFVFYGCKMSRWLQDYHSFQSCANNASSCRLFNGAVFSLQKKSGSGKVALLEERNTIDL